MAREITWRNLVIRADPDFVRKDRVVVEYEFTAPSGRGLDPRFYRDGYRVFWGDYRNRGPYRPQTDE